MSPRISVVKHDQLVRLLFDDRRGCSAAAARGLLRMQMTWLMIKLDILGNGDELRSSDLLLRGALLFDRDKRGAITTAPPDDDRYPGVF